MDLERTDASDGGGASCALGRLSDDVVRVITGFVGACEAAACLCPTSTSTKRAITERWRCTFPGTTPASACGADAWRRREATRSTYLSDLAARLEESGASDAAHHLRARGARVTVSDGAAVACRGTSAICVGIPEAPPLRVLKPSHFAAHDGVVAFARDAPSRALEVRWVRDGRGGGASWRSAFVTVAARPCGVAVRRRGRRSARAAIALYVERSKVTRLLICDVETDSVGAVRFPTHYSPDWARGAAVAVALLGPGASKVAVLFATPAPRAVVATLAEAGRAAVAAMIPGAQGFAPDSERRFDALVAWASTPRSCVKVWHYGAVAPVAGVPADGQIRACRLRRDVVFVLRVSGDLFAHRLLGASTSILVARFSECAPLDPAASLTVLSDSPALLLKARPRGGGGDVLYEVDLGAPDAAAASSDDASSEAS